MNDYMKALHQRFFREPEYPDIQRKLDSVCRNLQKALLHRDQDRLLELEDLEFELREEVSLAAFTAGFRLGMGIAGELEPYNFEDEEEERCQRRLEEFERRSLAQKGERAIWESEGRPATVWFASGRMAAGRDASSSATRPTGAQSSVTSTHLPRRN